MGHWLAGRLMKELGLVSCQQPAHRYKRGGRERVAIPNHLGRQFAVTAKSGMVRRRDVHLDGETLGIPCRCSRPVWKETGRLGNVVLSGQQTDHQSAENGLGNPQSTSRGNVPQRSGQPLYKQAVPAVTVALPDQTESESTRILLG